MYNFRNTWMVEPRAWDTPPMSQGVGGTANHFPARVLTFGDLRRAMVEEQARTRVRLTSTYRGRSLVTVWEVDHRADQGFVMRAGR